MYRNSGKSKISNEKMCSRGRGFVRVLVMPGLVPGIHVLFS